MKNIFITGVSGFVGTNLVNHLKDIDEIGIYGHSRNRNLLAKNHVNLISSYKAEALDSIKADTFVHLAGIAHDLSNQYKKEDYYRVNFEETRKVIDEFIKSTAEKFIFVSSIKALCDEASKPAEETMSPNPVTDYGKSKLMAEEYIRSVNWGNKSFYILRPSMMHGPGNKGNLNLLYRFAKRGLPFPFGAFHNQRSFHSICNFNFIIQSIIARDIPSGIYHLADDGFLSTSELYMLIADVLKKKGRVWNLPKGFIETTAALIGKEKTVDKLTENMMVSNKKLIAAFGDLPVNLTDGLKKTILSFDEN